MGPQNSEHTGQEAEGVVCHLRGQTISVTPGSRLKDNAAIRAKQITQTTNLIIYY